MTAALPVPATPDERARRTRPSPVAADILTISDNPILGVYLSGVFQQSGWSIAHTRTCASGIARLRDARAAIVICEEVLPDGVWHDVIHALRSIPDTPELIVVGDDHALAQEVMASGGFDALIRPLREADVVWTVASAWHARMKRMEAGGGGAEPCSDA